MTSARGADDLFIGFDHDRSRRQRELTENKNVNEKYQVTVLLKDVFVFAEHQGKAMYGLG